MNNKALPDEYINHQESYNLVKNLNFCVFDLETTGGNHKHDKIIEIGLVKIENLKIVKQVNYLIQPEIRIPEFIKKLTSISEEDVKDAPLIEDVMDEVLELMQDCILVAHNTSFDIPFFNSVLRRMGKKELENKSLCTNLMTKYLIPDLLNSNLNYMSKIFSIKHNKAHRALDDAMASGELLLKYLDIFIKKDIQKINHLYYPRNRYELDRIHYKKDASVDRILHRLKTLKTPCLFTLKGENGVILFALPCTNSEEEEQLIREKLETMDWVTTTIKLYGPLIEVLVHFNNLFTKMDQQVRVEVIKFLWAQHLPNMKMPHHAPGDREELPQILDKEFGDFIIAHHLVPEQMIIYPVASLHNKSQLIFRFPSHKKKLIQYINSKSSRIANNKLKKIHFHPMLKEFLDYYLKDQKENSDSLFIFKRKWPVSKPEEFIQNLEEFLTKNPNPYKYPSEYI